MISIQEPSQKPTVYSITIDLIILHQNRKIQTSKRKHQSHKNKSTYLLLNFKEDATAVERKDIDRQYAGTRTNQGINGSSTKTNKSNQVYYKQVKQRIKSKNQQHQERTTRNPLRVRVWDGQDYIIKFINKKT